MSPSRRPERRVEAILEDYIARRERGETPSPEEYYRQHPDLRDELRPWFEAYGFVSDVIAESDATPVSGPPERLGEFVILEEIGRGAFGVVYLAEQPSLRRRVALKVLHPHVTLSDRARQRFRREARVAAGLNHPHIVPVHSVGEQDGHLYFAMAFVQGETLDHAARRRSEGGRGPGYWGFVARIGAEVAEALAHAHSRGVIHRDLKPRNILISPEGKALLTDFGLARLLEEEGLSLAGDIFGTPGYMAPEQASGRGRQAGPAADIYALGAVLYECLAGRRAFQGDHAAEVLRNQVLLEPVPPRRSDPGVPAALEAVALRALARDPGRRYPSADAMAADLRAAEAGFPVARPARLARLAAAAALLLALGVGGAWWLRGRVPPAVSVRVGSLDVEASSGALAEMAGRLVWDELRSLTDVRAGADLAPMNVILRQEGARQVLEARARGPGGRLVVVEPVRFVSPGALPRHAGRLARRIAAALTGQPPPAEARPAAVRLLVFPVACPEGDRTAADILRGAVMTHFSRELNRKVMAFRAERPRDEAPEALCDRLMMDGWLDGALEREGARRRARVVLRPAREDPGFEAGAFEREFGEGEGGAVSRELVGWLTAALGFREGDFPAPEAPGTFEAIAEAIEAARAGRTREARSMLEREVEEAEDRRGKARAQLELGSLLGYDEPARARELFGDARRIYRQLGEEYWETIALVALGGALAAERRHEEAAAHLEKAEERARSLGDNLLLARALNNLGVVSAERGRLGEARAYWEQSADLFFSVGRQEEQAGVYVNLGVLLSQSRDSAILGCSLLEKAWRLARDCDNVAQQLKALAWLAWYLRLHEDPASREKAVEWARRAVELSPEEDPNLRFLLALAHWVLGGFPQALEHARRAIASTGSPEARERWRQEVRTMLRDLEKLAGSALRAGDAEEAVRLGTLVLRHEEEEEARGRVRSLLEEARDGGR